MSNIILMAFNFVNFRILVYGGYIMIYYFTGTGNSLWAAKKLAEQLGEQTKNLAEFKDKTLICNDDVIGIVCPTYMASLPWFVKKVFLNVELNPDAYVFLVVTSHTGKGRFSSKCMDSLLVRNGTSLMAVFDLQMPGNCMESSEKENEQRLAAAPAAIEDIGKQILAKTKNYKSEGKAAEDDIVEKSSFYGKKSNSMSQMFMSGIGKQILAKMKNYKSEGKTVEGDADEKSSSYGKEITSMFQMPSLTFEVTMDCDGCGICEKICPMQNISITEGKAIHFDTCAACCACLHWCPKHATLPTAAMLKGRTQYHHPEITLNDMRIDVNGNLPV